MKAVIKHLASYDVEDLANWDPGAKFWAVIHLEIGIAGQRGGDLFEITVCSPEGLRSMMQQKEVCSGRHKLFMDRYEYRALRDWLDQWVGEANGEAWDEIATALARIAHWEFEDFRVITPQSVDRTME